MTPREHMAEAINAAIQCGANVARGNQSTEHHYRSEGVAAGHAFRALEIGYDREQELLVALERSKDIGVLHVTMTARFIERQDARIAELVAKVADLESAIDKLRRLHALGSNRL